MELKFFAQGHFMLHSVSKTSILSLDSKALVSKRGFERVSRQVSSANQRTSQPRKPGQSFSLPTNSTMLWANQILSEMSNVGHNWTSSIVEPLLQVQWQRVSKVSVCSPFYAILIASQQLVKQLDMHFACAVAHLYCLRIWFQANACQQYRAISVWAGCNVAHIQIICLTSIWMVSFKCSHPNSSIVSSLQPPLSKS